MSTTYLELGIDRFRCALRADCVLGVVSDALASGRVDFRGEALPFVDLRQAFGGRSAMIVPFAVGLEAAGERLVVGVESVGHVQRAALQHLSVPELGLGLPQLTAEALREHALLWLVLEPSVLAELGHETRETPRETANLTLPEGGGYKAPMAQAEGPADSPGPVMTFHAAGTWLAVRLHQLDRIAVAPRLWPVPLASPAHAGLFDEGEALLPVFELARAGAEVDRGAPAPGGEGEHMLAILRARGERFAVGIDRPGNVVHDYAPAPQDTPPAPGASRMVSRGESFWLLDTDELTRSIQRNRFTRIH